MTPQSHIMVVAPVRAGHEAALAALLPTFCEVPGLANPRDARLPFGMVDTLHVARIVLLADPTPGDLPSQGLPAPAWPVCLALMADCDGPATDCLALLVRHGAAGLRELFGHCEGFGSETDTDAGLLRWLQAHDQPLAARYVNRIGRTVRQVHEEAALQQLLAGLVPRTPVASPAEARQRREQLLAEVEAARRHGRLMLTADAPTPPLWWLRETAHLLAVPLIGLVAAPFVLLLAPWWLWQLRRLETTDAELCAALPRARLEALQRLEDHDVTNPFTAIGAVKPGRLRSVIVTVALALLDYACRHVYHRGHLTRVQTIHFARWAFLDGKTRLVFASNYDGSLESYMDDFINKVAWGLNLVFSNGFGYPHTDWLVKAGARREQPFKHYLRGHQLATPLWYKAYPGLTVLDIERNHRIRVGLEHAQPSDAQTLAWLRLL